RPPEPPFFPYTTLFRSGGGFAITGTVTYHFFSGAVEVGTGETVAVGTDSSPTAGQAAGSYHYSVHYSGDANYNASDSADDPLTRSEEHTSELQSRFDLV